MKKTVKRAIAFVLAAIMAVLIIIPAYAEDSTEAGAEYRAIDLENTDLSRYITLGNYKNLPITLNVNVTAEDLDRMARENKIYVEVTDRDTAEGDTVNITYSGKVKVSGDRWITVSGAAESKAEVVLTETDEVKTVRDYIINSGKLVGVAPKKETEFTMTFPEDFEVTTVAGKEIKFTATVNYIKEYKYTDSYVKAKFGVDTVEDYRLYLIEKNLLSFADDLAYELYLTVTKNSKINSYPEEHLNYYYYKEYNEYLRMYNETYKDRFDTFEEFLEYAGTDTEAIKERAKYYVEWDLVMFALYKTGDFGTISDSEYSARVAEMAESYDMTVSELEELYLGKHDINNMIIADYVFELLPNDMYGVYELTTDFEDFEYLLEDNKPTGTTGPNKPAGTTTPGNDADSNGQGVDIIKIVGFSVIGLLAAAVIAFCVFAAVMTAKAKKNKE